MVLRQAEVAMRMGQGTTASGDCCRCGSDLYLFLYGVKWLSVIKGNCCNSCNHNHGRLAPLRGAAPLEPLTTRGCGV